MVKVCSALPRARLLFLLYMLNHFHLFAEKDMYGVLFEGEGRTVSEHTLADNEAPVLEQFKDNFLYLRRLVTGATYLFRLRFYSPPFAL